MIYDDLTLPELLRSSWDAFIQVGGNEEMYAAVTFRTEAQAYYAGQYKAFEHVARKMGLHPTLRRGQ
ncbi:MAG: hypothetical protein F4X54_07540 [Chloroflexi bacterium]|nr:hypothetical protein [Chloroflexota bacterium]